MDLCLSPSCKYGIQHGGMTEPDRALPIRFRQAIPPILQRPLGHLEFLAKLRQRPGRASIDGLITFFLAAVVHVDNCAVQSNPCLPLEGAGVVSKVDEDMPAAPTR